MYSSTETLGELIAEHPGVDVIYKVLSECKTGEPGIGFCTSTGARFERYVVDSNGYLDENKIYTESEWLDIFMAIWRKYASRPSVKSTLLVDFKEQQSWILDNVYKIFCGLQWKDAIVVYLSPLD